MTQTFKIEPAKPAAVLTLSAIATGCCLMALATVILVPSHPLLAWLAAAPSVAVGLLMAWLALAQRRSTVAITDRQLDLRLPLYGRKILIDEIVAGSQAKVSLSSNHNLHLAGRTNGVSVPGYNLGWFRTRDGGSVLAAVTGPTAVTWSTRGGFAVLLSVADADLLLATLDRVRSQD